MATEEAEFFPGVRWRHIFVASNLGQPERWRRKYLILGIRILYLRLETKCRRDQITDSYPKSGIERGKGERVTDTAKVSAIQWLQRLAMNWHVCVSRSTQCNQRTDHSFIR